LKLEILDCVVSYSIFSPTVTLLRCSYLHRHDDELDEIDQKNCIGGYRKGRHNAGRESALKDQLEREKREFDGCGLGEELTSLSVF
jgi:hypothetical protein